MFNVLTRLSFYWHVQNRRSRRAPAFQSWGLGAQQPCGGTLPVASSPLSLLILISCFCSCPVEGWAGSSGGAAGLGIKPFAGPGCCLGGEGLVPVLQPIVGSCHGWFCQSLTTACAEPFAKPGPGLVLRKPSLSPWDGTSCLVGGESLVWLRLQVAEESGGGRGERGRCGMGGKALRKG